jgi:lambda family phage portal protein
MIGEALDRAIAALSPAWGVRRLAARATMSQIEAFGNSLGGYAAGKKNRLTKTWHGLNVSENAIDAAQIDLARGRAWDLYRNSPTARKLVRTTCAKVIGRGLHPLSLAVTKDGAPNEKFRERAQDLWRQVACHLDYRGRPSQGGQSFVELCKLALRSVILTGEVLWRLRPIDEAEMLVRGTPLPLELQLIHAERLDTSKQGDGIYRGIEFDAFGRRKWYWILSQHPSESLRLGGTVESKAYRADEIGHLYFADDVDQIRGVTWLAPALMQMRDTADYQYNELRAAAVGACVVMGIRRPTGAPSQLGVNLPSQADTTDSDGTPITGMQPGMIFNLGADGALEGFNPARPATNAEAWIGHMLRNTASAIPGCKSSTLTGDYRNSSFSSERSADNDAWPELEEVQDWFAANFCQPIYEQVLKTAVLNGQFDGVVSAGEFSADMTRFTYCEWQGPVARSINPVDDAAAAATEIEAGTSSLQIECAKRGRNWQQVIRDNAEAYRYAEAQGLPEPLILQLVGLNENVINGVLAADTAAMQAEQQAETGDASGEETSDY